MELYGNQNFENLEIAENHWKHDKYYVVSTFTPRSISISNAMFTRSLLAACYLACSLASLAAVQYGT